MFIKEHIKIYSADICRYGIGLSIERLQKKVEIYATYMFGVINLVSIPILISYTVILTRSSPKDNHDRSRLCRAPNSEKK